MQHHTKVLIVEDMRLCATGLTRVLESLPNTCVCGHVENGLEVEASLEEQDPDILILDLELPGKHGLDVLEDIRALYPNLYIIILTMHEDWTGVDRAKSLGANAYLSKRSGLTELESLISSRGVDKFYLGKDLEEGRKAAGCQLLEDLTGREKEVIRLIVAGYTSSQISKELFISRETVKTHRKNIYRKLQLKKSSEVVRFAFENKLI